MIRNCQDEEAVPVKEIESFEDLEITHGTPTGIPKSSLMICLMALTQPAFEGITLQWNDQQSCQRLTNLCTQRQGAVRQLGCFQPEVSALDG